MSGQQAHKNTISDSSTVESGTSAPQNILGSPSRLLPDDGGPAPFSKKRSSLPLPQCKPASLPPDGQRGEPQRASSLNGTTGTKATPLPTSTLGRGGNSTSNEDSKLIASPASITGTAAEMSATPVREFLAGASGASVADLRHEAHVGGSTERSNESQLSKTGENVPRVNKEDAGAMKEAVSAPGDSSSVVTIRKKVDPQTHCLSHAKEVIILDSDDDNGADEEESFERKHQRPPVNSLVVAPSFSDAGTNSNDSARDMPRPCPDVTVINLNSQGGVSNCIDNRSHKKMIDAKTSIVAANDGPTAAPLPPPANSNSRRNIGMSVPDDSSPVLPNCENENPMKATDATLASTKTSTLESINNASRPPLTVDNDDSTACSISGKGKGTDGETNTLEVTTAEAGSRSAIEGGSNGTDDAGQTPPSKNPMRGVPTSPSVDKKTNALGAALSPSNFTDTDGESYMMTPPVLPQSAFQKSNMSKPFPVDTGGNHRAITAADSVRRERLGFAHSPPRTQPQGVAPYPHAETSTKRSYRSNIGVMCFNGSPTAQLIPPMQTAHQRHPPPPASYWPPCAQRPYMWNRPPQQYQQVPRYSVPKQPPPNAGVCPVGPYNISPFQNGNHVQGGATQPRILPNTHAHTEISRQAVHQYARQVLQAGGGFGAPVGVGYTSYSPYQHPQMPNGHELPMANNKYGPLHSPGVSPNTASSWFYSQQQQAKEAYQEKQKELQRQQERAKKAQQEAEQEREQARQASLPVIAIPFPDDDSGEVSVPEAKVGALSDKRPKPNAVHNQPLIGVAISSYTLDEIARMPVSFAYDVSDGGASEVAARKAAAEFESAKRKAMLSTGRKRKQDSELVGRPKGVATREKTAKKPRAPALEVWSGVPDEQLPPSGWPPNWTKKIFQRTSGATAGGRDRYWYSPGQKKFRSLVEVKRFLEALASVGGQDEEMAWKRFKNR